MNELYSILIIIICCYKNAVFIAIIIFHFLCFLNQELSPMMVMVEVSIIVRMFYLQFYFFQLSLKINIFIHKIQRDF